MAEIPLSDGKRRLCYYNCIIPASSLWWMCTNLALRLGHEYQALMASKDRGLSEYSETSSRFEDATLLAYLDTSILGVSRTATAMTLQYPKRNHTMALLVLSFTVHMPVAWS
jgi:hypothetical protein